MENREKDIQAVCNGVMNASIVDTGDSGTGGWDAEDVSQIGHELHCIVLIAKDLSTRLTH